MGILGKISGVIAIIMAVIPLLGFFALIPACIGMFCSILCLILSALADKPMRRAVGGIVLNALAIGIVMLQIYVLSA